jgi:hypothetical protein
MSRKQLIIFGAIALVTIVLVIFLFWLGLVNKQKSSDTDANGVTYTDTNSGQNFTAFPETSTLHGDGDSGSAPVNEVSITGMDDFFTIIGQDEASSILSDLTAFIHAHSGTGAGAKAAVLNGQVTQTSDSPKVYQFTLVLQQSDARYNVTITMPNGPTTPDVVFGGVTQ